MPVGGIQDAAADIKARREAGQKGGIRYFKIGDGEEKVVRFLEEGKGIHWAWTHKYPPRGNMKWGEDVPCLDQKGEGAPCPGCEQQLPKKFKGFINLIERDADEFAVDAEGKVDWNTVVGKKDAIRMWEQGITVFEDLDSIDADYGGLTSRDFKISRKGTQLNTSYKVRPADPDGGRTEMSKEDEQLAAEKYDLVPKITPPDYDEAAKRLDGGTGAAGGGGGGEGGPPVDISPFVNAE